MTRRYPLAPFLQLTGWSMSDVSRVSPANGTEYRLRRAEGVTELIADRLAVAAGLHSWLVWPELADHALEDATRECAAGDCDLTFLPVRADQKYCSRRCGARVRQRGYLAKKREDPAFRAAEAERRRVSYEHSKRYELARARRLWRESEAFRAMKYEARARWRQDPANRERERQRARNVA